MITNNTELKKLPEHIKFSSYNSNNEDVILGEYLIALLLYNGASFQQILDTANVIEDIEEKTKVKIIMSDIIFDLIKLNHEFDEILKRNKSLPNYTK